MITIVRTEKELQRCVEYCNQLDIIAIDTETEGFDVFTKKLLSLQVGNKNHQFVIDCLKVDILPLKSILEEKICIAHNMKFDWKFLYHKGINIKYIYDTFLAECILTTGWKRDDKELALTDLTQKYLGFHLDKSIRGKINYLGFDDLGVIAYAARDIEFLEQIMNLQLTEISKWRLDRVLQLENEAVRVFALMEYNGIAFDKTKLNGVIQELNVINTDLTEKLDNIIINEARTNRKVEGYTRVQQDLFTDSIRKTIINWRSPAQKTEILNRLGIPVNSVDDKTLQKLKNKHPIVPLFIELSKFGKLESSFGKSLLQFINPITQRVHSSIWQILVTGRISMSYPNLQQIPSHSKLGQVIKSCFIASEGYKIVSADYSGMELRIIAEFSQDPTWIKIFREDKDLHSELCALTFNIPIEKVIEPFPGKPDISYRFLQKTINFGLAFGMTEYKLSDTAQISVQEAKKIIKMYFSKVPLVEKFLNMIAKSALSTGFIKTDPDYFKRIRWFPELDRRNSKSIGNVERAAKNVPSQGTNANITKQALINLQNEIDTYSLPVRILLSVHDEIITECEEYYAEEWKPILERIMIETAQLIIKSIPVKVEGTISDYWTK